MTDRTTEAGPDTRELDDQDESEEEPAPLWGEDGPKVGQVITIAGTNLQTRWTGTHWEKFGWE